MKSFDNLKRKRIYLFRHGEVSYINENGTGVADPTKVSLTKTGENQAMLIDQNTQNFKFERIACSGLLRTKETAGPISKRRGLKIEIYNEFDEIKGGTKKNKEKPDIYKDIAYHFENISSNKDKFFGSGENYFLFQKRILRKLEEILTEEWHSMALILHGGVNAMILSWVANMHISGAAIFDQVPGCMNIVDIDFDKNNKIYRKTIRAINIPPDTTSLDVNYFNSWEGVAEKIKPFFN